MLTSLVEKNKHHESYMAGDSIYVNLPSAAGDSRHVLEISIPTLQQLPALEAEIRQFEADADRAPTADAAVDSLFRALFRSKRVIEALRKEGIRSRGQVHLLWEQLASITTQLRQAEATQKGTKHQQMLKRELTVCSIRRCASRTRSFSET